MKRGLILVLLCLLSVNFATASGFDDEGHPNDPTINDRANACYEGSTWEGKCDTLLEWVGGWYYIRFEAGIFSREEIPDWLSWILPPLPEEAEITNTNTNPQPGCYDYGSGTYCFLGGNEFALDQGYDGVETLDFYFAAGSSCVAPYNGHSFSAQTSIGNFTAGIQSFAISKGFDYSNVVCRYIN
jgi:hypothetical protein